MGRRNQLRAIYGLPVLIGLLTIGGLFVALTGDGWRDALSWVALGVPIAAVAVAIIARKR